MDVVDPGAGAVSPPRVALASPQAGFVVLQDLAPTSAVCNFGLVIDLRGAIDVDALQQALAHIVSRHAALRTAFRRTDGTPQAWVDPGAQVGLRTVDVRDSADPEAARAAEVDSEATHCFDLQVPPLMRATLVRVGDARSTLVVVCHHTVADGYSLHRVFADELSLLYGAFLRGDELHLLPLRSEYAEFARWSGEREASADAERKLEHWRERLREAPTALTLPTDRPHPPRMSYAGRAAHGVHDRELAARIEALAKRIDVKTSHVLMAVWALLLSRYSGQGTVVLGVPTANRRRPQWRGHIGCFVDTLPVRLDVAAQATLADLARHARASLHESMRDASVPLSRIAREAAAHPHDPSRTPVYQAMFNYMPFSADEMTLDGLEVSARRLENRAALVDVSLDIFDTAGGHRLALDYNLDVFEDGTAQAMLRHFGTLLRSALEGPEMPLDRLDLLSPADQREVLAMSIGPDRPHRTGLTVHRLMEERAQAFARRPAVIADGRSVTYQDLYDRARRLAHHLVAHGVGPGSFVAVCLQDPHESLVTILAVLFAGAAYVPIDAEVPALRLRETVDDCGALLTILDPARLGDLAGDDRRTLCLPRQWRDLERYPTDAPAIDVDDEQPAYLIYTSGSTGKPQGVVVRHRNLVAQLLNIADRHDEPPGVMAMLYSFAFDSSLASVGWTLYEGGCLVLLSAADRRDPGAVRRVIERHRVTHVDAVPSMYAALLSGDGWRALRGLRVVICGGEALPAAVAERHWEVLPDTRLYNEYGPTENTVTSTAYELPRGTCEARIPIGRPLANNRALVLDERGALVPLGHPGELYVGGDGVAAGYHGRPELTAARFVADPHAREPGELLYRTGDLVRYRRDGCLEFLGRVDSQVQLGGLRVELGEIEAALAALPHVETAVVIASDSDEGATRLVAYVVAREGAQVDGQVLKERLGQRLPRTMVPSLVVLLDEMPLNANGKIDKAELAARPLAPPARLRKAMAPLGTAEQAIADIYAELLDVDVVGRDDDFFDLGGDSLLALQLLDKLERHFHQRLPLASLLETATVSGLAARLGPRPSPVSLRCVGAINPGRAGRAPLFFVGSARYARVLAGELGPARPVYGFSVFGLQDGSGRVPRLDVARQAERLVQEAEAAAPTGPICLAGYCVDSKVAYEAARRLRQRGREVPFVALIDGAWLVMERPESEELRLRAALRRTISRLGVSALPHKIAQRVQTTRDAARRRIARARRRWTTLRGRRLSARQQDEALVEDYYARLAEYQAPAYDGRVVVFTSDEWHPTGDPTRDRPTLELVPLPGLHDRIFEGRALSEMAAQLRAWLGDVDVTLEVALADAQ